MKRFFVGCLICCTAYCSAEDIIITQDAKSIKGKITEVGIEEIKYIPSDNPMGPTYCILRSDVATIVYDNGKVENFKIQHLEGETKQMSFLQATESISEREPLHGSNDEDTLSLSEQYDFVYWDDDEECFTLHGQVISKEQYLALAKQNCNQAYEIYKQRYVRKYLGASFLGAGVSSLAVSTIIEGACLGRSIGGWVFFGLGHAFTAAGIPLLCISRNPEEHSIEQYNAHASERKNTTFINLQCSQDGIGVALHF